MADMQRRGLYISGQEESGHGDTFTTINPANGEVLAEITAASQQDIDRAVASAKAGPAHLAQLYAG